MAKANAKIVKLPNRQGSRTQSVSFVGLTVALMVVSAWVTVPLGPVPFTLQTFVVVFALVVLPPKEALAAIACYLLMGAVGLPVFSGMRGGLGVVLGPTGGFLWGFLAGGALALCVRELIDYFRASEAPRPLWVEFIAACVFLAACYACGASWYSYVAGVSLSVAFATAVAPFVAIDLAKTVAALATARAVRAAVPRA